MGHSPKEVALSVTSDASKGIAHEQISKFDYSSIPDGYYHEVLSESGAIRKAWHLQKFERVLECLTFKKDGSLLDIGCFAGTFLSLVSKDQFSHQLGVDILPNQVAYAEKSFGTDFRSFKYLPKTSDLSSLAEKFDCITLIEVIEHLRQDEIKELLIGISSHLKPGGEFVLSTPNYASTWPILEFILNRVSEVSYEEQHITRFTYFNFYKKLCEIAPNVATDFDLVFKTTTHFLSPFIAPFISVKGAAGVSRLIPHVAWKFPFGNLTMMVLKKKESIRTSAV